MPVQLFWWAAFVAVVSTGVLFMQSRLFGPLENQSISEALSMLLLWFSVAFLIGTHLKAPDTPTWIIAVFSLGWVVSAYNSYKKSRKVTAALEIMMFVVSAILFVVDLVVT